MGTLVWKVSQILYGLVLVRGNIFLVVISLVFHTCGRFMNAIKPGCHDMLMVIVIKLRADRKYSAKLRAPVLTLDCLKSDYERNSDISVHCGISTQRSETIIY